ncbi:hypothetical protein N7452_001893 [Penicillium brevicompactum]|uniref:Uncharacterized protein n=1 Tax=Penicillium brevicompactum TaxID=5074 RepID=A0A9W9R5F6_PENBR|nr:hypothetical protein N7452_001893 [Penicillium brevicompactum]
MSLVVSSERNGAALRSGGRRAVEFGISEVRHQPMSKAHKGFDLKVLMLGRRKFGIRTRKIAAR